MVGTVVTSGRLLVVCLLPLAVLLVDPRGLAPFGPLKWMAVSAGVLAAAAAVTWGGGMRIVRRPARAWAAFLLVVAVAASRGIDPLYAWIGTPERHLGALTWLLCALAFFVGSSLAEEEGRTLAGSAVAAAAVVGAWAPAEVLGWQPLDLAGGGDRPVGPFGSSAYLGAATLLLGAVALGAALDPAWGRRARIAAAAATAGCGVGLVASGARAAWVGALAAAVGTVMARPAARKRAIWLPAAMAVVACAGLAFATGVAGRVPDVVGDDDGGARGRLDEWRVAARVVAANPLLGVGPEGYRIAFGRSVDDAYEKAHGRSPLPDRAHDSLLDVAAAAGLPGLIAYLAVIALTAQMVLRALGRASPWVAGAAAGLVGYFAQSLFLFPLGEIEPLVWLVAGVVAAQVTAGEELVHLRAPRAVPVAAGALAAVALVAGSLDVVADRHARATLAATPNDGVPLRPGRAARLRPDALRYRLVAARALSGTGSPSGIDKALKHLDAALRISPRDPVVRSERGRLLLERARRSGSTTHLRTARAALGKLAEDDPRNAEVLLRLGLAEQLSGNGRQAERAWLAAERLAPRSAAASTDLALAYARAGRNAEAAAAARRALARDPTSERARRVLESIDGT
ncbi:MAG TPA: O-antigen ligase family protein [Acidimicrobiales bacterium]|nr:O-antigen ligase family protein [Acidimicrobiales bacterium]